MSRHSFNRRSLVTSLHPRPNAPPRRGARALVAGVVCAIAITPAIGAAQLTLDSARRVAQAASPDLRAQREAVLAAQARERQAGALLNPVLVYGREQTSRGDQTNAQNITQLEQSIEVGGQRAARRAVARVRVSLAMARLDSVATTLDYEVATTFARVVTADQRARLADETAAAFAEAQRVSDRRLAAGDVSGYAARRLRLEGARFAAVRSAAALERRTARVALATLMGLPMIGADSLAISTRIASDGTTLEQLPLDSLLQLAQRDRAEARLIMLDTEAARADAHLVARERIPTPVLSAGYKGERVADPTAGSLTGFRGVVAGLTVPLPLFDRRAGAIEAAAADTRRVEAARDAVRRRVAREVADALDNLRAVEAQRAALAPQLGEEGRAAIRAIQASYAEGEVTLVEWLDAMRAYQEAESTLVTLQGEVAVRRAALARAVGASLFPAATPLR
ncbi:MAG: TolC family protein [Gemmatimonadaceae bacterium]|nr:TolC family protein [Gemmatimonadaceae bacterium]